MIVYKNIKFARYYCTNIKGEEHHFYIDKEAIVYIDGILIQEGVKQSKKDTLIMHFTFIDDRLVLHREDGPAYIEITPDGKNYYYYHYLGVSFMIEDMPIDGVIKLFLTLKNGDNMKIMYNFYGYENWT